MSVKKNKKQKTKTTLLLSDKQYKLLEPLLYRKGSRQRVMLYLIAGGYTVGELVKMKVTELKALPLHHEILVARDEMLEGLTASDQAFVYSNGQVIPHTYYYRLLRTTGKNATGTSWSQEMLREYIR